MEEDLATLNRHAEILLPLTKTSSVTFVTQSVCLLVLANNDDVIIVFCRNSNDVIIHSCLSLSCLVLCPAGKMGGKIRLVTLRTILGTHSILHTFRQEFERANRNAAFFNHCNSEDGKCELHLHSFTILTSMWLQLRQLMPWLHSAEVRASTKNSAQCYQTNFSSDFSGWARD